MKRTSLMLDERLLEEVKRVSGEKSYSRAVTRAIEDYLCRQGIARIFDLARTASGEGDLSERRRPLGQKGSLKH